MTAARLTDGLRIATLEAEVAELKARLGLPTANMENAIAAARAVGQREAEAAAQRWWCSDGHRCNGGRPATEEGLTAPGRRQ
jgi:protein-disulfide isomerase-like protein with CxxC motif